MNRSLRNFKPDDVVKITYRDGYYKVINVRSDNYLFVEKIMKDSGKIILPGKTTKFLIREFRCIKITEEEIENRKNLDMLKWDNLKSLLTKSVEQFLRNEDEICFIKLEEISAPDIDPCK